MSRAIKFRLYLKVEKKYIDYLTIGFSKTSKLRSYSTENGVGPVLDDNYIVEQYTGLKDKNGKEICEGDIVRCWDDESGEVYFCDTSLQYRVRFNDGDDEDLASCEAEIISNIHETPKGGEK